MKALKEKRNSFRSLWRMGLVILSVFVLTFALVACGDSNTANPGTPGTPPELKPDNGDDNGGDGPGTAPTAKKITSIQLVSPVSASAYSQEGKVPNLSGLEVAVIYDDTTTGKLKVADNMALFGTAPAVLGQDQVGTASGGNLKVAAPVWISVFPKDDQYRAISVELPGVQALVVTGSPLRSQLNSYDRTGDKLSAAKVIGLPADDVKFSGLTGIGIYEDEFQGPPEVKTAAITVKYQGLYKTVTGADLEAWDGTLLASASALLVDSERVLPAGSGTINLGPEHIFYDYHTDFLTTAKSESSYLEYGLDLQREEVAFLISRGKAGTHGGPAGTNQSIFVIVPFNSTTFHYVRSIEVSKMTYPSKDFAGKAWPEFLIQSDLLALDFDGWNDLLIDSAIELKVFYDDYTGFKTRPVAYFERAVDIGVAGVMNYNHPTGARIPTPNVSNADEDNFGFVSIAYYTSLPINGVPSNRDPIGKGDFPNVDVYKLPIATYTEQANFQLAANSVQESDVHDGKLRFVADDPAQITGGQRITDAMYKALQNSYQFVGNFSHENQVVVKEIIPPTSWQPSWFSAMTTNEIDENFEVNVNVRNAAANYAMFNGAEATFYVRLYPREYDTK